MTARARLGSAGRRAAGRLVRMPPVPQIPEGRLIELPGRGATFVTDTGPPDRPGPAIVLLHALACTGLLTWYPCLDALGSRWRVVLFDQRWHGQGIRSHRFDLDDCADDVVAVADALGIDSFVAAGYSMGSLVAQLTWRRHPDRVDGLILAASTTHFATTPQRGRAVQRIGARLGRVALRQQHLAIERAASTSSDDAAWAWRQFRATSGAEIAAAGAVIARFDSRDWIADVDVPTSVVVTARDRLIPPDRQRALGRAVPNATVHEADAGHAACVLQFRRFRPAMLAASESVTARLPSGRPPGQR